MRCVMFDLFDTLATISADEYIGAKHEMARILGVDEAAFEREWRESSEEANRGAFDSIAARIKTVASRLDGSVDETTAQQAADVDRKLQLERCYLLPGARETLERLKSEGYTLGLVSNCYVGAEGVLERLGIASFLDSIVLSYEVELVKPEEAIYRLACRRLACDPAQTLFVGDGNDNELDGAKSVGLRTVLLERQTSSAWATERSTEADYTITSIPEVIDVAREFWAQWSHEQSQT